jgi:hypothetical protein
MIAIDALKPFVAAFMGWLLLGDVVPWLGYLGVVVCALGVYLLNVESAAKEEDDEDAVEAADVAVEEATEPPYLRGYAYATVNVVLDVYAATITVAERGPLSSAEVNLLRFGLAAVLLILVWALREGRLKSDAKPMARRDWMRVALGVVFVTFLTPLITVWSSARITFVAPDSRVDSRTGLDDVRPPAGRGRDALVADAPVGAAGLGLLRAAGVATGGRRRCLSDGRRRHAGGCGDMTAAAALFCCVIIWYLYVTGTRAVAPGPGPVRGRSDASGRASGRRLRRLGPCYACRNWETRFGAFLKRASQV